jgi:hypothetical protein
MKTDLFEFVPQVRLEEHYHTSECEGFNTFLKLLPILQDGEQKEHLRIDFLSYTQDLDYHNISCELIFNCPFCSSKLDIEEKIYSKEELDEMNAKSRLRETEELEEREKCKRIDYLLEYLKKEIDRRRKRRAWIRSKVNESDNYDEILIDLEKSIKNSNESRASEFLSQYLDIDINLFFKDENFDSRPILQLLLMGPNKNIIEVKEDFKNKHLPNINGHGDYEYHDDDFEYLCDTYKFLINNGIYEKVGKKYYIIIREYVRLGDKFTVGEKTNDFKREIKSCMFCNKSLDYHHQKYLERKVQSKISSIS